MADVHFQHWLDFPTDFLKIPLDLSKYPKLEALKHRVEVIQKSQNGLQRDLSKQ